MLRVISLGAGVQSTTMALMAAHGEIGPMPDCAIFADTGWEPAAVYAHLDWLKSRLPFPVYTVRREGFDLGYSAIHAVTAGGPIGALPPYFLTPTGMINKQCSKEFKTRPVLRKIRRLLGVEEGQRAAFDGVVAEQWLGISLDEAQRMKPCESRYIEHRWPLIERRMTRRDCLKWIEEAQYPRPPKSSCIFCPFKGDAQWRDMRDNHPDDWARAVAFDAAIRPGFLGMEGAAYLHRERVPLDRVDLSTAEDRGQLNMFNNECEGMCGV